MYTDKQVYKYTRKINNIYIYIYVKLFVYVYIYISLYVCRNIHKHIVIVNKYVDMNPYAPCGAHIAAPDL